MTVRVDVAPAFLPWALRVTGAVQESLHRRLTIDQWLGLRPIRHCISSKTSPRASGVPLGHLLLPQLPEWAEGLISNRWATWWWKLSAMCVAM